MESRKEPRQTADSRVYHLLIFGSAAIVLLMGALWRGGAREDSGEASEVTAIDILRKEVSGVQSALMRNELEVIRDAMTAVSAGVASSVIALTPRPEAVLPDREIGLHGATANHVTRMVRQNPIGISGLVIDRDGHILTSASVVQFSTPIHATFSPSGSSLLADLISVDETHHLALLKLREVPPGTSPLNLSTAAELTAGEWLVRQGRTPSGETARSLHLLESIQNANTGEAAGILQDQAGPQMEGACLVNSTGQIVGIYVHPSGSGGFVIPIRRAVDAAIRLKSKPMVVTRGWTGLQLQELSDDLKEYFAAPHGALIASVDPESPASKAGLRPGDLIEIIDETPASGAEAVLNHIGQSPPGTRVVLGIKRNSRRQRIELTLAPLPGSETQQEYLDGSLVLRVRQLPGGNEGVEILSVQPRSIAKRVGVRDGDVILAVNGTSVRSPAQFWRMQRNDTADKRQLWTVRRGEKQFFIAIKERVAQP